MRPFAPAVILLSAVLCATLPAAEKKPIGQYKGRPFSAGLMVGDTLYVSGHVGRDAAGKIPEDFEAEVRQALENVGEVLKEAGLSFADAVSVQVYLTDMSLFERMNKVYMTFFPEPRPTRTTVGVAKLVGTARIEITVTARPDKTASRSRK